MRSEFASDLARLPSVVPKPGDSPQGDISAKDGDRNPPLSANNPTNNCSKYSLDLVSGGASPSIIYNFNLSGRSDALYRLRSFGTSVLG
jgi:hypothetical protein